MSCWDWADWSWSKGKEPAESGRWTPGATALPASLRSSSDQLTYSCFSHLMKRMSQNFPNGGAMDTHFANMRSLIQVSYTGGPGHEGRQPRAAHSISTGGPGAVPRAAVFIITNRGVWLCRCLTALNSTRIKARMGWVLWSRALSPASGHPGVESTALGTRQPPSTHLGFLA